MRAECAALALLLACGACEREQRNLRGTPSPDRASGIVVSELIPGGARVPEPSRAPQERIAWDLNEGKRLFDAYNCSGCHAHGGGGMGPALIDAQWTYGSDADQIYRTILEGRPNGMPAWRGKITDAQIWQLAAYVRSLSGLAPKDAAPGRSDHMAANPPENAAPERVPVATAPPRPY